MCARDDTPAWPPPHDSTDSHAATVAAVLDAGASTQPLFDAVGPYVLACARGWLQLHGVADARSERARALAGAAQHVAFDAALDGAPPRTLLGWYRWYVARAGATVSLQRWSAAVVPFVWPAFARSAGLPPPRPAPDAAMEALARHALLGDPAAWGRLIALLWRITSTAVPPRARRLAAAESFGQVAIDAFFAPSVRRGASGPPGRPAHRLETYLWSIERWRRGDDERAPDLARFLHAASDNLWRDHTGRGHVPTRLRVFGGRHDVPRAAAALYKARVFDGTAWDHVPARLLADAQVASEIARWRGSGDAATEDDARTFAEWLDAQVDLAALEAERHDAAALEQPETHEAPGDHAAAVPEADAPSVDALLDRLRGRDPGWCRLAALIDGALTAEQRALLLLLVHRFDEYDGAGRADPGGARPRLWPDGSLRGCAEALGMGDAKKVSAEVAGALDRLAGVLPAWLDALGGDDVSERDGALSRVAVRDALLAVDAAAPPEPDLASVGAAVRGDAHLGAIAWSAATLDVVMTQCVKDFCHGWAHECGSGLVAAGTPAPDGALGRLVAMYRDASGVAGSGDGSARVDGTHWAGHFRDHRPRHVSWDVEAAAPRADYRLGRWGATLAVSAAVGAAARAPVAAAVCALVRGLAPAWLAECRRVAGPDATVRLGGMNRWSLSRDDVVAVGETARALAAHVERRGGA